MKGEARGIFLKRFPKASPHNYLILYNELLRSWRLFLQVGHQRARSRNPPS
jgi:hypothetical protein